MSGNRRRLKELQKAIESLGFNSEYFNVSGKHIKCGVKDDKGHIFFVFTGSTPSDNRSLRNFKQDVRLQSLKKDGKIG